MKEKELAIIGCGSRQDWLQQHGLKARAFLLHCVIQRNNLRN